VLGTDVIQAVADRLYAPSAKDFDLSLKEFALTHARRLSEPKLETSV
jgi:hypothetical protein